MTEQTEAERLAQALDDAAQWLRKGLVGLTPSGLTVADAAKMLRTQAAEIDRLKEEVGEVATIAYMQGASARAEPAAPAADPRKQALDNLVRHSEELGLYDMDAEPAAAPAGQPEAIPWRSIIQAVRAVGVEAARRGSMFPQGSDEQAEDRAAVNWVCRMLEWYATKGGAVAERLDDWPKIPQPTEQAAAPQSGPWAYTNAIGEAARNYCEKFSHMHPLPHSWRWQELWERMLAASQATEQPKEFGDLTGVRPCCGEFASCHRPCTPRGRWEATRAFESNAEQPADRAQRDEPVIHCAEKRKPGGCQLHNLHCGWPECNKPVPDEALIIARRAAWDHNQDHGYLPQSGAEVSSWQPHEWVLAAIRAAALQRKGD